jgi:hypothetical protein
LISPPSFARGPAKEKGDGMDVWGASAATWGRVSQEENISPFFARNQLKSLDSEK